MKPPAAWQALVDELEGAVRAGRGRDVAARIARLARRRVPRAVAALLAQLAWRSGVPLVGIRILRPLVRENRRVANEPEPEEIAEYAQCLVRVGATSEAVALLRAIAPARLPRAWLYEASAHMSRWDYAAAYPLVVSYAKAPGLTAYQRLVGKINVAACLVCLDRHLEAEVLLRDLLHELSLRRHFLLYGNALELAAQSFALRGKWRDVEAYVDRALATLAAAGTRDVLYARKWRAIARLLRRRGEPDAARELQIVRAEAIAAGDGESVRQCDEFEAVMRGDATLLARVYFGTPHEPFRARIARAGKVPDEALLTPGEVARAMPGTRPPTPVFDLSTGTWRGRATPLRPGGLLLRLLAALASDAYVAARPAAIHQAIYPGEWFHPESSPFRIYEAMKRLRQALEEEGIPLAIVSRDGAYRLEATGPCALRYRREARLERWAEAIERIRALWTTRPFSVSEASARLGLNPRTVLRWLDEAREAGAVERLGRGRALRFAVR